MQGRGRAPAGLRAAWERQQAAAALAEAARRAPRLEDCKPLLLAAQLEPILTALSAGASTAPSRGAGANGPFGPIGGSSSNSSSLGSGEPPGSSSAPSRAGVEEGTQLPRQPPHQPPSAAAALEPALRHLERLVGVDPQPAANAALLLWLLLLHPRCREEGRSAGEAHPSAWVPKRLPSCLAAWPPVLALAQLLAAPAELIMLRGS